MDYPEDIDEYELMYGDEMDMANEPEYQAGKSTPNFHDNSQISTFFLFFFRTRSWTLGHI